MHPARRKAITSALSASALLMVGVRVNASQVSLDYPDDLAAAIRKFTGGANWKEHRVTLDVAELVDNGNTVPIGVSVSSAMTPSDHVTSIAIFNEKNPYRDVALFTLSQDSGKAEVVTRMRLATTQRLVAIAKMSDGSFCSKTVEVIVTLASCVEID